MQYRDVATVVWQLTLPRKKTKPNTEIYLPSPSCKPVQFQLMKKLRGWVVALTQPPEGAEVTFQSKSLYTKWLNLVTKVDTYRDVAVAVYQPPLGGKKHKASDLQTYLLVYPSSIHSDETR